MDEGLGEHGGTAGRGSHDRWIRLRVGETNKAMGSGMARGTHRSREADAEAGCGAGADAQASRSSRSKRRRRRIRALQGGESEELATGTRAGAKVATPLRTGHT